MNLDPSRMNDLKTRDAAAKYPSHVIPAVVRVMSLNICTVSSILLIRNPSRPNTSELADLSGAIVAQAFGSSTYHGRYKVQVNSVIAPARNYKPEA